MSLTYKLHAIMYAGDYTFTYFCIGGSYKKQLTKNGEHVYTLGASDHIVNEVETMGRDLYEALARNKTEGENCDILKEHQ